MSPSACVASVSVGRGSKERPKNGIFGVFPALSRLACTLNPLGYLFFYEALTMYMSLAVYLSQICHLFCFAFCF